MDGMGRGTMADARNAARAMVARQRKASAIEQRRAMERRAMMKRRGIAPKERKAFKDPCGMGHSWYRECADYLARKQAARVAETARYLAAYERGIAPWLNDATRGIPEAGSAHIGATAPALPPEADETDSACAIIRRDGRMVREALAATAQRFERFRDASAYLRAMRSRIPRCYRATREGMVDSTMLSPSHWDELGAMEADECAFNARIGHGGTNPQFRRASLAQRDRLRRYAAAMSAVTATPISECKGAFEALKHERLEWIAKQLGFSGRPQGKWSGVSFTRGQLVRKVDGVTRLAEWTEVPFTRAQIDRLQSVYLAKAGKTHPLPARAGGPVVAKGRWACSTPWIAK